MTITMRFFEMPERCSPVGLGFSTRRSRSIGIQHVKEPIIRRWDSDGQGPEFSFSVIVGARASARRFFNESDDAVVVISEAYHESTRQAKKAGQTAAAAAKGWKLAARYVGYEAQPARVLGAMEWIYRQLP